MGNRSSTIWGSEANNADLKQELDPRCAGRSQEIGWSLGAQTGSVKKGLRPRQGPSRRQMDQGWPKPWRIKVKSSLEHAFQRANKCLLD